MAAVRREVLLYVLQPRRQVVMEGEREREREEREGGGEREAKDRVRHVRKGGQELHLGKGGIEKRGMCKGCRT